MIRAVVAVVFSLIVVAVAGATIFLKTTDKKYVFFWQSEYNEPAPAASASTTAPPPEASKPPPVELRVSGQMEQCRSGSDFCCQKLRTTSFQEICRGLQEIHRTQKYKDDVRVKIVKYLREKRILDKRMMIISYHPDMFGYEVALGSGQHALLKTDSDDDLMQRGWHEVLVEEADTEDIITVDGAKVRWPVYQLHEVGRLLMKLVRKTRSGPAAADTAWELAMALADEEVY